MFGAFPGYGGVLPSYYPYLAAMGVGRCNCPNTLQFLPPFFFTGVIRPPTIVPIFVR